jgi:hypothetical protein
MQRKEACLIATEAQHQGRSALFKAHECDLYGTIDIHLHRTDGALEAGRDESTMNENVPAGGRAKQRQSNDDGKKEAWHHSPPMRRVYLTMRPDVDTPNPTSRANRKRKVAIMPVVVEKVTVMRIRDVAETCYTEEILYMLNLRSEVCPRWELYPVRLGPSPHFSWKLENKRQ